MKPWMFFALMLGVPFISFFGATWCAAMFFNVPVRSDVATITGMMFAMLSAVAVLLAMAIGGER